MTCSLRLTADEARVTDEALRYYLDGQRSFLADESEGDELDQVRADMDTVGSILLKLTGRTSNGTQTR